MSMERELGQISEAVSNLKKRQDEIYDEVRMINCKMDTHIEKFGNLRVSVAKISSVVSLIVAGTVAYVKDALSK